MSWLRKAWSWLRWVLLAVAAFLLWRLLRVRLSHLLPWVERPIRWARIPGNGTHVVVENPATGKHETVELPAGVESKDVASVGISKASETYEVEPLHDPRDRRAMLRRAE